MATIKRNYNMTEVTDRWVKLRGNGELYASESEYIRSLVIRDIEQNSDTETIRAALAQAEHSGMSDMTPRDIKQSVLKRKNIL
jgi:Arc/MetJ-type ribon-helix-helix transcriptional regulator